MTDSDDMREPREKRRSGSFQRRDRRDAPGNICYKWQQGSCNYGDRCRFAHDGPGGTVNGGGGRGGGGRGGGSGGGGGNELFVRGLDYDMTKEDVRSEILKDTRGVLDIILPLNRDRGDLNRGFCILKFDSEGDAQGALERLNGREIRGRSIYVRWSEDGPGGGGNFGRGGGGGGGYGYDRFGGGGGGGGRRGGGECYRWSREGHCQFGSDCRFDHIGTGRRGGSSGSGGGGGYEREYGRRGGGGGGGGGRDDICYSWQRDGSCSYGNTCRFAHP